MNGSLVAPRLAGMTGGGLSVFIALFTDNCRLKRPHKIPLFKPVILDSEARA
ncbi:hypothetical protein J0J30_15020 [Vibrio vulnificus]|nr:hypothetical protein [Vibrio vulnificus]